MVKLKDVLKKKVDSTERDGSKSEVRGLDDQNHPHNVNRRLQENKLPSLDD